MEPIYIDFNEYYNDLTKLPSKIWTEKKGEKIDEMYDKYEDEPVVFKKYLNKLLRNDPINNVYLLTQHLNYLLKQVDDYESSSYDDEHDLKYIKQYRDLVDEVLAEDIKCNQKKYNFPFLNLDMINEFWYYFNKDEDNLKEYIRNILIYPGNYTVLVEFKDYMRNYQHFFDKDYNAIDKNTNKKITDLIEVTTKALSYWYNEIPERLPDNPMVYIGEVNK
jgi:hypothetical protein